MGGLMFLGATLPGQGGSQYSATPDPKVILMPTPRMVLPLHVTLVDDPAVSRPVRCLDTAQYGTAKCKMLTPANRWIG